MIRRPPRSTLDRSSAASDVYKRQRQDGVAAVGVVAGEEERVRRAGGQVGHPGDVAAVAQTAGQRQVEVEDNVVRLTVAVGIQVDVELCLLYTSPSPRDRTRSRMPSSA